MFEDEFGTTCQFCCQQAFAFNSRSNLLMISHPQEMAVAENYLQNGASACRRSFCPAAEAKAKTLVNLKVLHQWNLATPANSKVAWCRSPDPQWPVTKH